MRAHRGQEVKNLGDGLMVVFPTSVADALACGVAMQRAIDRLGRRNPVLRLAIGVGISEGEATTEDNDWFGTRWSRRPASAPPARAARSWPPTWSGRWWEPGAATGSAPSAP
ncbi:MAG: hypothetical protein H0U26_06805 [Acidimicrobiia bacterium]|nr:hypothetical protein [Acidimicrobiia bacterium]